MKNCLILVFCVLFCFACKPKAQIIKEETIKTLEYRDTVFKIAPDLASLALWLKCDSAKRVQVVRDSVINGTKTRIVYRLANNRLNVVAKVDSSQIAFHWLLTHNMVNNVITAPSKSVNWWKVAYFISWALFILILGIIFVIFIKK